MDVEVSERLFAVTSSDKRRQSAKAEAYPVYLPMS